MEDLTKKKLSSFIISSSLRTSKMAMHSKTELLEIIKKFFLSAFENLPGLEKLLE
jgi:hypothetical protein